MSVDLVTVQSEPLPSCLLRSILVRLLLFVGNGGCCLNADMLKMRKDHILFIMLGLKKREIQMVSFSKMGEHRFHRAVSAADKMFLKQRDPDNPSFCGWQEQSDQLKC